MSVLSVLKCFSRFKMCTSIENSFFLKSLSLVNCRVYECSFYLRYSSIKLDSKVVSIGLKKVCSYRRVFVMEFFLRLAYYK